ncbi:MAG TPA: hypothetical protein VMS08_03315 [Candidatus Saccharimonadia bacterium]|nr:hypothetical protein [Candidatus Saccharimonadia bacterium]
MSLSAPSRYALVTLFIIVITCGLLVFERGVLQLSKGWLVSTGAFLSSIAVIKFAVSPAFFGHVRGISLTNYLVLGILIALMYLGYYILIQKLMWAQLGHHGNSRLSLLVKLGLVGAAVVLVYVLRLLELTNLFPVLRGVSYITDLLHFGSMILPAFIATTVFFGIVSSEHVTAVRPARKAKDLFRLHATMTAILIGLFHVLWAINMIHVFGLN